MLRSDTYEQGYRKVYNLDTNKGKLTLGSGQVGNLLEAVLKDGVADLNGKTFSVKSNGKTEKDIRYFFNVARAEEAKKPEVVTDVDMENELDLSAIPFQETAMEQYNKLLETLRAMHIEVLKKNVLDDPTLLGDYMVRMRGYAEFLVPYVNQALSDADDKLMRCETERNRIYKEAIDAGESQNAAATKSKENTRLLDAEYEVAKNEVKRRRNEYERFSNLCTTMQSRLREFGVERVMESR